MTTIVRIIEIRDTRQYEEIGDRWVPISGSGNARPCDRCGRDHEVHVDVELSDGRTAVIGSGCARGESADVVTAIRKGESAAKRRAKIHAELVAARAAHAHAAAIHAAVAALPLPVSRRERRIRSPGGRQPRRPSRLGRWLSSPRRSRWPRTIGNSRSLRLS